MALSNVGPVQSSTGLDFKSLLQIILQQLTYQDPLKPMDNFQFVSQLAQFSQLQQSQTLNESITSLLNAQATTQATSLLGKKVDIESMKIFGAAVTSIAFSNGQPTLTVKSDDTSIGSKSGISLSLVTQILAPQ